MTMQVTMRQTRMGESGALLIQGSTYVVSKNLGAFLVGSGFAADTAGALGAGNKGAGPAAESAASTGGSVDAANVLTFGDSMTDFWEAGGVAATSATYDQTTGVITVTAASHERWTGFFYRVWNFNYPSLYAGRRLPITRVAANTFTITLADKPTDIPTGALAATLFIKPDGCPSYTHWLGLAQLRLGHRLRIVANGSQNGDTSVLGLARLPALLAAYPQANLVAWQLHGLNDQSSTWAYTEAQTIAANRAIIDTVVASGKRALILSTTPVASGEARGNLSTMQRIKAINADAEEYSRRFGSVAFVDAYGLIVDPTDATGYAVASYLRAADKIHYLYAGATRVAEKVQAVIEGWFPTYRSRLVDTVANSQTANKVTVSSAVRASDGVTVTLTTTGAHNWRVGEQFRVTRISAAENGVFTVLSAPTSTTLTYANQGTAGALSAGSAHFTRSRQAFGNPLLLTATGGTLGNSITGAAASLMRCYNASGTAISFAAASVVAAPDGTKFRGVGNEQRIVVSSTGPGTQLVLNDRPGIVNAGSTTFLSDLLPNRLYRFGCRLRIASANWANTPCSQVYGVFVITWSTGEYYNVPFVEGWDGVEAPTLTADQDWHCLSVPISTVPPQAGATMSNVDITCYVRASGAHTAALTFAMSQVSLFDVTEE